MQHIAPKTKIYSKIYYPDKKKTRNIRHRAWAGTSIIGIVHINAKLDVELC